MAKSIQECQRETIVAALREKNGNVTDAAKELMIGRTTLYRKMQSYDIEPWEYLEGVKRPVK